MKVLVTGANGFVGRWMVRHLVEAGHVVVAAEGPERAAGSGQGAADVERRVLDLGDLASVRAVAQDRYDAVVHLAGQASGGASFADPGVSWEVNAGGTARLAGAIAETLEGRDDDPAFLLVSTADVYADGGGRLIDEDAAIDPRSPYAASKLGAELAAREVMKRTGLKVMVARAFPHTGPGQDSRFVAPVFAERLQAAKREGRATVTVGNLALTRDFLDVRDVVAAYAALLETGDIAETYNVASGVPVTLEELFRMLARLVGHEAAPVADPALVRDDAPWLVGDSSKLRAATGWSPRFALEDTLRDLVHAQAH